MYSESDATALCYGSQILVPGAQAAARPLRIEPLGFDCLEAAVLYVGCGPHDQALKNPPAGARSRSPACRALPKVGVVSVGPCQRRRHGSCAVADGASPSGPETVTCHRDAGRAWPRLLGPLMRALVKPPYPGHNPQDRARQRKFTMMLMEVTGPRKGWCGRCASEHLACRPARIRAACRKLRAAQRCRQMRRSRHHYPAPGSHSYRGLPTAIW